MFALLSPPANRAATVPFWWVSGLSSGTIFALNVYWTGKVRLPLTLLKAPYPACTLSVDLPRWCAEPSSL